MNLVILLDRLDQLIGSATEIPLTGKSLVDTEEALDLIDKIRNALPEEVKRAEWLTSEKDRMLKESQAEAERIVVQAEEYAAKLVSESEIVRRAREEAQRILEQARQEARQLEKESQEYAERVLANLEEALQRTMNVVKQGRENLKAGKTESRAT